jgi:ubiquinone/menaquinone biosynthesis C-methylase UbiE
MRVAEMVSRYSGCGNVLDVGCWTGGLAVALADMARCSYTGVDIETAARAVAAARTTMPDHRFMLVSSVEALPFDAALFDVAVLTECVSQKWCRSTAGAATHPDGNDR